MPTVTETKKKTVRMNGCVAAAQAAKFADVDVITAYPIRPYTATNNGSRADGSEWRTRRRIYRRR